MSTPDASPAATLPAPQAAASVLVVRDGATGLEVYLLRRSEGSSVLGGAWVFPGGKVDAADADAALQSHIDLDGGTLQVRLNEDNLSPSFATALHVAAAREVFEECGLLFAGGLGLAAALQAPRGSDFHALLHTHALRLTTRTLRPWSRWITPVQSLFLKARRFDTRFFVAALPEGQQATPDAHETTDGRWFSPREALQRYWDGEMELVPPQLMSLAHLSHYPDTQTLLHAAAERTPHRVQPEVFAHEGNKAIAYPGDPIHPEPTRVMPGPLRLVQHGPRMVPEGGLDAFFV